MNCLSNWCTKSKYINKKGAMIMRTILRGAKIIDCVNPKPLEGYEIIIKGDNILSINKKGDHIA